MNQSSSRPMTSKEAANEYKDKDYEYEEESSDSSSSEEESSEEEETEEDEPSSSKNIENPTGKKPRKKREKRITSNDTYKCDFCTFMTGYLGMFERHLQRHTNEKAKRPEYKCNYCDKKFRDQLALSNHSNIHLGMKPYKCDLCESAFGSKGEADRHIRYRHTQEKPHKCTVCGYSTVEKTKLRRHMRIHTNERPYMCGFCEYASSDTFKLKRHMRIHTGEKPYECPHCKRSFAQSNTLKTHIKIFHTSEADGKKITPGGEGKRGKGKGKSPLSGEKRSKKTTSKKVTRTSSRKLTEPPDNDFKLKHPAFVIVREDEDQPVNGQQRPQQQGHQPDPVQFFKCTECYMKFLTKELFDDHYVKHTGDRPYECDICKLKFGHKSALQAHKRSHDPSYHSVRRKQAKLRKKKGTPSPSSSKKEEEQDKNKENRGRVVVEDEPREVIRTCTPRPHSPLGPLMKIEGDDEYHETPIVNSTFHVTGSPHRLFLLNTVNSSICAQDQSDDDENYNTLLKC